jgi:hypothetical protein
MARSAQELGDRYGAASYDNLRTAPTAVLLSKLLWTGSVVVRG